MDGDGIDDLVVYRDGDWYVYTKRTGAADLRYAHGGMPQDMPVLFDGDGDGKARSLRFARWLLVLNTQARRPSPT